MNVVQGNFPQNKRPLQREDAQKKRAQTIIEKVEAAKKDLCKITRGISKRDKEQLALNLADLIEELAQSDVYSGDKKKALKQVWEKWGQKDFSKRLRYVRFQGEKVSEEEVISSSGMDFVKLAETIADLSLSPNISQEDFRIECIRRLLADTEFDVDPVNNAKIDFNALKEMGEILEYMLKSAKALIPELEIYFKKIVESGIAFEGPANEEVLQRISNGDDRFVGRISLIPELNDSPKDFGIVPIISSSACNYEGRLEVEKLYDGMTFDMEDRFTDLHFPKVYLGKIDIEKPIDFYCYDEEKYKTAKENSDFFRSVPIEALQSDKSEIDNLAKEAMEKFADNEFHRKELCTLEIEIFLAITYGGIGSAARTQLSLILWPSMTPASHISASHLIADLFSQPIQNWESEIIHVEKLSGFIKHDEASEFAEEFLSRAIDTEIKSCASVHWGIQSSTAKKIFAIENINYAVEATDRPEDNLLTATFNPNFKVPDAYAPISTRTLAGQLVRNILYTEGDENILEQLIADAKLRIEWVNNHFRDWEAQYLSAKEKLKSKFSISILGNNAE